MLAASTAWAQVSCNNEDEVYKIDRRAGQDFVPGEVLVKMKDGSPVSVRRAKGKFQAAGLDSLDAVLHEFGVEEMEQVLPGEQPRRNLRRAKAPTGGYVEERDLSQLYRLRMAEPDYTKTRQLTEKLQALGEVEFAEPNYKVYIMGEVDHGETIAPNPGQNPSYPLQWGIPAMKIDQLWTKPLVNSTRPVIAILDTGVDTTHPDLTSNCIGGYDFINETSEMRDNNGHGTHVAGIAAAADNGIGIIGANPRALIMPVTVMQSDGTGDMATIIRGINYAINHGATVINMSFGSYSNSAALRQALAAAYQSAVLVAAAGNDGLAIVPTCDPLFNGIAFPAGYSFVLGVQATGENGALAGFSNYDCDGPIFSTGKDLWGDEGVNYELAAPGVGILSTIPGGGYRQYNGTSMAAPLVAGAISALKMVKQYDTQEVLWGDLLHTADFLAAYNLTDRPAELDVLGLQFDDRKELVEGENNVSSDGRIDAGETIRLYPVLRTTFGEASNIKLHLEVGEFEDASVVTIMQNDVDFGYNLSPFGKAVSETPIIFKTKGNVTDGRHIVLKLTATCDGMEQELEHAFTITVDNITKIGGLISKDMTLTADKSYLVTTNLAIPEGVTLTIQPGTTVMFDEGTGISCNGRLVAKGEIGNMITLTSRVAGEYWNGINSEDTIEYSKIMYANNQLAPYYYKNCNIQYCYVCMCYTEYSAIYCNISNGLLRTDGHNSRGKQKSEDFRYSNCINNESRHIWEWNRVSYMNYFNNEYYDPISYRTIGVLTESPIIVSSESPAYIGTAKESIARTLIYEIGAPFPLGIEYSYGSVDLSNMRTEPYSEAHGIVWKVLVNGKDAQDEYEEMLPLGVGRHKFEVYYNRPMNKAVAPNISFGVREPYTQNAVNEDGAWNEDGTVYTAYVTITKKTQSDGVNRIYVYGGEDNEYFECPYEKTRFNVNIQAAASMSTGFMAATAPDGVRLTWNKEEADDLADAMGYNIYRYVERVRYEDVLDENGNKVWDDETDDWQKREIIERDTIRINTYVIDVDKEDFTDKAVEAGQTYHYFYKLQGTNLKEYGISNTVSVQFEGFTQDTNYINSLSELSNNKQYLIHTRDRNRGTLGTAGGHLGSTNPATTGEFAIRDVSVDASRPLISSASQLSSPFTDPIEGSIEELLDGNTSTFWHSTWHGGNVANGTHYLQVENVESYYGDVAFRFTRRNTSNDHITLWSVYGTNTSDAEKAACTLLAEDISTPYGTGTETVTSSIFNTKGYRYLRFYIDGTSTGRGYGHMSEFQLYPATRTDIYDALPFAILQADGGYYLYNVKDKAFVSHMGQGLLMSQPWQYADNQMDIYEREGSFVFDFRETGSTLNVNAVPGIAINNWGTQTNRFDDGNMLTIEEVGDFDPTEALAALEHFQLLVPESGLAAIYTNRSIVAPDDDELLGVYYGKRIEDDRLYLGRVGDIIPQKTPVLVMANPGLYTFSRYYDGTPSVSAGLLRGADLDTNISDAGGDIFVFGQNAGEAGFYREESAQLAYHCVYVVVEGPSGVKMLHPMIGAGAVGIDEMKNEELRMKNGSAVFNLSGQRLTTPQRGINIIGGKKVVRQ